MRASTPLLPPPAQENRALALTTAPRSIVVYTPPVVIVPPPERAITVQETQVLDVEWIDVYQFRLPTDAPEACYIASPDDLGCTIKQLVRGGHYTMVQIRLARLPRQVYDDIPGVKTRTFADCG